jgi:hypothetical protein
LSPPTSARVTEGGHIAAYAARAITLFRPRALAS